MKKIMIDPCTNCIFSDEGYCANWCKNKKEYEDIEDFNTRD